jgi:hypothetical protein
MTVNGDKPVRVARKGNNMLFGDLPKKQQEACALGDNDYYDSLVSPARWEKAKLGAFRDFARTNTKPEDLPGLTVEEKEEYIAFLLKWKADHDGQT